MRQGYSDVVDEYRHHNAKGVSGIDVKGGVRLELLETNLDKGIMQSLAPDLTSPLQGIFGDEGPHLVCQSGNLLAAPCRSSRLILH